MEETVLITKNNEPRLTQPINARYARYMSGDIPELPEREEAPKPQESVHASQPQEVVHKPHILPRSTENADDIRAVHEVERKLSAEAHTHMGQAVDASPESKAVKDKKEHEPEELNKLNILQALWKALVEAFSRGTGAKDQGALAALELSEVFSDVVAGEPDEHTLMLSYLNWQKLATENKESTGVLKVAAIGLQEVKKKLESQHIDIHTFEENAKKYYVEHENEISIANLRNAVPEAGLAKDTKTHIESLHQQVTETLQRNAPILPGEIFSPSSQLDQIMKKPHAEREIALPAFKEKLAYQNVGLTNLHNRLIGKLSTQPDMTQSDIDREIMAYSHTFGFDDTQLGEIAGITDSFLKKRETIKKLEATYTKNGVLDKDALFRSVMGIRAEEKIPENLGVFFGPISVGFTIEDKQAFKDVVKEDTLPQGENEGRVLAEVANKDLKNMVIVLNSVNDENDEAVKRVKTHETQHVIDSLFLPLVDKAIGEKPASSLKQALAETTGINQKEEEEKKRLVVDRYLGRIRDLRLEEMHTEIFAFNREGMDLFAIEDILLGKNSPYLLNREKELGNLLAENDQSSHGIIQSRFDKMFSEYKHMTKHGIELFQLMLNNGYTHDQIFGLLGTIPLKNWEKVVARQLGENVALDTQSEASEFDTARLQAAREKNKGNTFNHHEGSVLGKNKKFTADLPDDTLIPIDIEEIVKIKPSEYKNPDVKIQVERIRTIASAIKDDDGNDKEEGLLYKDLQTIRAALKALAPADTDSRIELRKALRILDKAEATFYAEAEKERKEFEKRVLSPRQELLLDLNSQHMVKDRYQAAVDLIRLQSAGVFAKKKNEITPKDVDELLNIKESEEAQDLYIGKTTVTHNVITWVEELQKVVWIVERNINKGKLDASPDKKRIIDEFANEDFSRYKTKDDMQKLQGLLNQLLSDTQRADDNSWAMVEAPLTGKIKHDTKVVGVDVTTLFGEVATQKRRNVRQKRAMNEVYEIPPSFQDVVEQVIGFQAPPEYRTGGPFEVIDRKGEPNFANLERFIRSLIIIQHKANPQDNVDLFRDVNFPGLINLDLGTLTDIKKGMFRITNYVEITGNLDKVDADGKVVDDNRFEIPMDSRNLPKQRGDDPEVNDFMKHTRDFAYNFWQIHNYNVQYTENMGRGLTDLAKMLAQIHHKNDYISAIDIYFKMVETNMDSKDFTNKLHTHTEGNVGNAMRMALLLYKHLDELADNRRKKNKDGTDQEMKKYFEDNMFYKVLTNNLREEDRGGLDDFFFTVAGEAIAGNATSDSRTAYKKLVRDQLQAEFDQIDKDAKEKRIDAKTEEALKKLTDARIEEVTKDPLYGVRIDTNIALAEVLTLRYERMYEKDLDGYRARLTKFYQEDKELAESLYKGKPTTEELTEASLKKNLKKNVKLFAEREARDRMKKSMLDLVTVKDKNGNDIQVTQLESLVQLDKLYPNQEEDKKKGKEKKTYTPEERKSKLIEEYKGFVKNYENKALDKYGQLEGYAFNFLKLIDKDFTQKDLNIFDAPDKSEVLIRIMRTAIRNSVGTMYGLNDVDKTLSEEVIHSYSRPILNFAALDKDAVAFDGISRAINEYAYLQKTESGRGGTANPHGLRNIIHGIIPFMDFVKVIVTEADGSKRKVTVSELLQGGQLSKNPGEADQIDLRRAIKKWDESGDKSGARWGQIHVPNGADLFEDRDSNALHIDNIIKQDIRGNYIVDRQAAQKLLKDRWKKIRYSIGSSGGVDLDGGELLRTRIKTKDENGNTIYKFEWEDRVGFVLGTEVRHMMEKQIHRKHAKGEKIDTAQEGARAEYKKEIADMIAAGLDSKHYHQRLFASDIEKVKIFYTDFAKSSFDVDDHGHTIKSETKSFYDKKDWEDILEAAGIKPIFGLYGTRELRLEFREGKWQLQYGFSDGIAKMFKEFFKKIGGEVSK